MNRTYAETEPPRAEIDALPGAVLVEFGSPWCGHCSNAQPLIAEALSGFPQVRHLKIEDGRGRSLGRTFGVKLWPTLVFMADGREIARIVRPRGAAAIREALERQAGAIAGAG